MYNQNPNPHNPFQIQNNQNNPYNPHNQNNQGGYGNNRQYNRGEDDPFYDPTKVNQLNKQMMHDYRKQNFDDLEPYGVFNASDKQVRLGFIRKVYIILSAQLITTFLFVLIAFLSPEFREFQQKTLWLMIVCMVLTIVLTYALGCYRSVARSVPLNYILLAIFTLAESYLVSFIASKYEPETVLIAAGLTCAITVGLTLYAIFTKTDFTTCGGILVVCVIALLIGSIIAIFIKSKILNLILAVLGTIIFGIYLVFDTQLVIGQNKNAYSIDDYIFAAMNLYIDIIQIFLYMLRIVAAVNE